MEEGVLESYHGHMMSSEKSLLSKIYGVYSIRIEHMQELTCFIMDNLLGADFMHIERIYDLKGSTVGRSVNLTQEQKDGISGLKVLKDLNFIELNETFNVVRDEKKEFLNVLQRDSEFLARNSLMDYSLLFIKARKPKNKESLLVMPAMIHVSQADGTS